ncbi:hypothetical protein K8O93_00815 [Gordonia bronchialis]|uniref:hypothetical protein n=1 Tax=Gordonia bronchialis TaxID=2054 RepID=UPI001CC196A1|nr:hypothetical protein [Gordonia bronchialis]UAK38374.1 hypothetical protein K8O93_00815 [Gordonia bronchialis]
MTREIIFVAGAGEQLNSSMVPYRLTRPAHRRDDKLTILRYDNSIGPVNNTAPADWATGLDHALRDGEAELAAHIRRTPYVPVLVGYSLGAYVISSFLERMALGAYRGLEVAEAVLIANPRAGEEVGRKGIAGAHGRFPAGLPVVGISNYHDIVCRTPVSSALRKLPGLVSATTADPQDWGSLDNWLAWLAGVFVENNVAPTVADIALARGYFTGAHTSAYFDDLVLRNAVVKALR